MHRYLARCGVASRRAAEKLVAEGRIAINGTVVTAPGNKVNPHRDRITVDGKAVRPEKTRLYLFHKPPGVLSTMKDPHGRRTVADFTGELPVRVFPVGRLDNDVSGLILLTNDGELANQLLHPRYGNRRSYLALVEGAPAPELPRTLMRGVELEDGPARALEAEIATDNETARALFGRAVSGAIISLEVGEGRNHLVKRLLAAVGHPVQRLIRVAFGPYRLGDLPRGKVREVSRRESVPDANGAEREQRSSRRPSSGNRSPAKRTSAKSGGRSGAQRRTTGGSARKSQRRR